MSQSETAASSAPLPSGDLALDHPPPVPQSLGDFAETDSHLDSPFSRPQSLDQTPDRPPPGYRTEDPLEHDALSSESSQRSCDTAAGDAPHAGTSAPAVNSAVSRRPSHVPAPVRPPLSPPPLPPPPHRADAGGLAAAGHPSGDGELPEVPQRARFSPWVAAWLAQVPSPTSHSRDGGESPRSLAGSAPAEDRLYRHPAARRTPGSSAGVSAAAEDADLGPSTAQHTTDSAAGGSGCAQEPLESTRPSSATVDRHQPAGRSAGGAASTQPRLFRPPAAQSQPEPSSRPVRGIVVDDGYRGTTDMHPAQLAMALRSTASLAPSRTLVSRSVPQMRRRKRVLPAVPLVAGPLPLGLGSGSGLPHARKAATVAATSKVRTEPRRTSLDALDCASVRCKSSGFWVPMLEHVPIARCVCGFPTVSRVAVTGVRKPCHTE